MLKSKKPSQYFFYPGGQQVAERVLTGAGVLTDFCSNPTAAGAFPLGTTITLRDGSDADAKVLYQTVTEQNLIGLNIEFERGLFVQIVSAGPIFPNVLVGAYIQDRSPDPMAEQLHRLTDELARLCLINKELAAFLKGLQLGNPAT